jgi:hypothetical protein
MIYLLHFLTSCVPVAYRSSTCLYPSLFPLFRDLLVCNLLNPTLAVFHYLFVYHLFMVDFCYASTHSSMDSEISLFFVLQTTYVV